jgi:glycosyltransferase involved in cell wall biosynthesis
MKKIMIIDTSYKLEKMFLDQTPKLTKGFIRLGNDVRCFSYNNILKQLSPLKSRKFSGFFYKKKADNILSDFAKSYKPDIVIIGGFPKCFDGISINRLREAVPKAIFVGGDGDPWPKLNPGRIETAKHFDMLTGTNDGQWLQDYRDAGVKNCIFMPNMCDPDTDHRYDVGEQWKTDILFTGQLKLKRDYPTDNLRSQLAHKLIDKKNCSIYGCLGRPKIGGLDYFYAISGAKIGVSVNAVNDVRLYHSDRLTHYMSCGTFVLAKRVPDSDLLFKDGVHIKYFDTVEEFFELANWYLKNEDERLKIANAGMKRAHTEFNGTKIAQYILDIIEKGSYDAPWNR